MMLYLVATPIGNLADITQRAVDVLKCSNYILCEDTRHSHTLLKHYGIDTPVKSYHKFNERAKLEPILDDLAKGFQIALVSDAGTPGISDPGELLVQNCLERNIPVSPIPGPCALIAALSGSGLETSPFQFVGFLPRKEGEMRKALHAFLAYEGTTVCYESPNRLQDALELLAALAPDRRIVIARELTKKFEEFLRGTAADIYSRIKGKEIKGEIVLMIAGRKEPLQEDWLLLPPKEHVAFLEKEYGLSKQEAIVVAAKIRGVPKRDVYNAVT